MRRAGEQRGFGLIEVLAAMSVASIVVLAALSILNFARADTVRLQERVHVDQTARTAVEAIMRELHSGCIQAAFSPVQAGSTTSTLIFVSESGEQPSFREKEEGGSPEAAIHKREFVFANGTLIERVYASTGHVKGSSGAEEWQFATTPTERTLLTGVSQIPFEEEVWVPEEHHWKKVPSLVPVFEYHRFYRPSTDGESGFAGLIWYDAQPTPLSALEASEVAEVGIAIRATPELAPNVGPGPASTDRPIEIRDQALFRQSPASTESGVRNAPCE